MINTVKCPSIIREFVYINNNYIVNHIPFWPLRRFLYKLQGMKIGKGSRILMGVKVLAPRNIEIGDYTFINEKSYLDGRGKIQIGDNVTIAVYSKLITGSHDIDDEMFSYRADMIRIDDNVAIFTGCIILGGATIEKGCVFSAGSMVRRGLYEKCGVYAGNPAKHIRIRKSKADYRQNSWSPLFR